MDDFHETDMRKTTKGGIMGARVFYIRDLIDSAQFYPKTAEELATVLRGREMPSGGKQ